MRDSAYDAERRAAEGADQADQDARARAWRDRADQYSVCDLLRRSLYPRSKSARIADDSVRQQGDWRATAKYAALVMAGKKLSAIGFTTERVPAHVAVKESVFPFGRFPGVDTILGPEM